MRQDRRPYRIKKAYLRFRDWYTRHYLAPACDELGDYPTFMKPWYISISGPNIRIGRCATIIAEPEDRIKIGVWGREPDQGSITIGDNVLISPGTRISAGDEVRVGDNVMMANGVYITDSDWHGIYNRSRRSDEATPVRIKDNAWLGDGCKVLKGVTVGENSIVAAGAVVAKDVPDNVVVAGNPAVIVKELDLSKGYTTRAALFEDPERQARFYDEVDRMVLGDNGYFNWLRGLLAPRRGD